MIKKNLSKTLVMATLMAVSGLSVQAMKQEVQIREGSFKKFLHAISCGCFRTHDNAFVEKQEVVTPVAPVVQEVVVAPVVTAPVVEKKKAPSKEELSALRKARPAKAKLQEQKEEQKEELSQDDIADQIVKELDEKDFSTWTLEYQDFYVAHESEILPVMTRSAGWCHRQFETASVLNKKIAVEKWVKLLKKNK